MTFRIEKPGDYVTRDGRKAVVTHVSPALSGAQAYGEVIGQGFKWHWDADDGSLFQFPSDSDIVGTWEQFERDEYYRQSAAEVHGEQDLEIPLNARVEPGEGGAWVEARVWVEDL